MADQVIRPRLSLDEVEAVSDLGARLQTSAQNGPFRAEWFRQMNG